MASSFQNRLVGTVVVVALAVIFLPDILDGKKISHKDTFVTIPQRPNVAPVTDGASFPQKKVDEAVTRKVEIVTQPINDDDTTQAGAAEQQQSSGSQGNPAPDKVTDKVPASSEAKEDQQELAALNAEVNKEKPVTAGWVIQLGVFRHDKNVKELLDKLQAAGYRAFSQKINTASGELTKVFVGPDVDDKKLQKSIPHLKEVTGLNGRVTAFTAQ